MKLGVADFIYEIYFERCAPRTSQNKFRSRIKQRLKVLHVWNYCRLLIRREDNTLIPTDESDGRSSKLGKTLW